MDVRSLPRGEEKGENGWPSTSRRSRASGACCPHTSAVMPDSEAFGFRQSFPARAKPAHSSFSHCDSALPGGMEPAGSRGFAQSGKSPRQKPGEAARAGVFPGSAPCAFAPGRRGVRRQAGRGASRFRAHLRRAGHGLGRLACQAAAAFVIAYRVFLSPLHPPACRFYPSCSAYALQAYRNLGFWKATWLSARRLLRCHPFHPGGVDFPPSDSGVRGRRSRSR
jgi:putative membrane protein insertion efficiency factor